MSDMTTTTNDEAAAGALDNVWAALYCELLATHSHDALCEAYGLHRDGVEGGTHWTVVISQAIAWGDIDLDTMELT